MAATVSVTRPWWGLRQAPRPEACSPISASWRATLAGWRDGIAGPPMFRIGPPKAEPASRRRGYGLRPTGSPRSLYSSSTAASCRMASRADALPDLARRAWLCLSPARRPQGVASASASLLLRRWLARSCRGAFAGAHTRLPPWPVGRMYPAPLCATLGPLVAAQPAIHEICVYPVFEKLVPFRLDHLDGFAGLDPPLLRALVSRHHLEGAKAGRDGFASCRRW